MGKIFCFGKLLLMMIIEIETHYVVILLLSELSRIDSREREIHPMRHRTGRRNPVISQSLPNEMENSSKGLATMRWHFLRGNFTGMYCVVKRRD
jgi:hypothetical protein